jgi:catechol 2,3-dioxygenase-like lactoylglutathione lyase family enzyme
MVEQTDMVEQTGFGLNSIGQISVTTHDVDRAVAFYRDQLGMRFLFRFGDLAFFDCGGIRLMLSIAEQAEFDHRASVIYYRVADIRGAYETLQQRGVVFRDAPHKIADLGAHELWMTFFQDPDDNVLALMSEIPKA